MTLNKYKAIDIAVFCVIAVALEALTATAFKAFSTNLSNAAYYSVSFTLALSVILCMRWNYFAALCAAFGGAAYCYFNNASFSQYAVYIIGNSFVALCALWFLRAGTKQKITKKAYAAALFALCAYAAVCFGRAVVAAVLGNNFFFVFADFASKDALNGIASIIIVLIARKQSGMFEDQVEYLKRIKEEMKA